jgi:hypothetical protein
MEERVLELVVYKLNDGVSREQFLGTNDAVSSWISKQPGFVSRELAYDADGDRWVDRSRHVDTFDRRHAVERQRQRLAPAA